MRAGVPEQRRNRGYLLELQTFNYQAQATFQIQAELVRGDLKQLLKQGRVSLLIGFAFVSACLTAADAIVGTNNAAIIARESLTIIGWVAMWRPLQIFLYEW